MPGIEDMQISREQHKLGSTLLISKYGMNAKTKERSNRAQKINGLPRFVGFGDIYWQRGYLSLILGIAQFSIKEKKVMVGFQVEG